MTVAGETITDERLAEIINGCDGVSPGPWSSTIMEIGSDEAIVRSAGFVVATTRIGEKPGRYGLNADHIARLDPQTVRSLLTELQHRREAEAGAPEGWVLVPREPTQEMIGAGLKKNATNPHPWLPAVYRAMLAASPSRGEGE